MEADFLPPAKTVNKIQTFCANNNLTAAARHIRLPTMLDAALNALRRIFRPDRPKTRNAAVGRAGEDAAAKFLKAHGFKILERNYRSGRNEIDIIALDGGILVFVEVKTRKSEAKVGGFYAGVSRRKTRNVHAAARDYMIKLPKRPQTYRFDIVEVSYSNSLDNLTVRHYPLGR